MHNNRLPFLAVWDNNGNAPCIQSQHAMRFIMADHEFTCTQSLTYSVHIKAEMKTFHAFQFLTIGRKRGGICLDFFKLRLLCTTCTTDILFVGIIIKTSISSIIPLGILLQIVFIRGRHYCKIPSFLCFFCLCIELLHPIGEIAQALFQLGSIERARTYFLSVCLVTFRLIISKSHFRTMHAYYGWRQCFIPFISAIFPPFKWHFSRINGRTIKVP